MTDRSQPPRKETGPGWEGARWQGDRPGAPSPNAGEDRDSPIKRFLGGAPLTVMFRLLIVSLVVGALLMWLDIRPLDIVYGIERFFHRIWHLGFGALREVGAYILAGAVVVVPVWFVLRLLNMRR